MGTQSEEDFDNLFEDMDLNSTKLGKTAEARNAIIVKVLSHLDEIDFQLDHTELDVLGDAYEYLIGQFAAGSGKKAGEFYTPQQISDILSAIVTLDSQEPVTGQKERLASDVGFHWQFLTGENERQLSDHGRLLAGVHQGNPVLSQLNHEIGVFGHWGSEFLVLVSLVLLIEHKRQE